MENHFSEMSTAESAAESTTESALDAVDPSPGAFDGTVQEKEEKMKRGEDKDLPLVAEDLEKTVHEVIQALVQLKTDENGEELEQNAVSAILFN